MQVAFHKREYHGAGSEQKPRIFGLNDPSWRSCGKERAAGQSRLSMRKANFSRVGEFAQAGHFTLPVISKPGRICVIPACLIHVNWQVVNMSASGGKALRWGETRSEILNA